MAGKKKDSEGPKKSSRERLKKIESRLKKLDKDLVEVERELTEDVDSKVVDADIAEVEELWRMKTELVRRGARVEKKFYKHFVLRCMKCMKEFKHRADIEPIIKGLTCPGCDHDHSFRVTPGSRYFHIEFPDSIEVVDSDEE
ncbi:MAG: hypothetical protein ABIH11_04680 [Candidatus Altiarchaeota archaeon]